MVESRGRPSGLSTGSATCFRTQRYQRPNRHGRAGAAVGYARGGPVLVSDCEALIAGQWESLLPVPVDLPGDDTLPIAVVLSSNFS